MNTLGMIWVAVSVTIFAGLMVWTVINDRKYDRIYNHKGGSSKEIEELNNLYEKYGYDTKELSSREYEPEGYDYNSYRYYGEGRSNSSELDELDNLYRKYGYHVGSKKLCDLDCDDCDCDCDDYDCDWDDDDDDDDDDYDDYDDYEAEEDNTENQNNQKAKVINLKDYCKNR